MSKGTVEVCGDSIRIVALEVAVKDVADFFRTVPAEERAFTLMKAIEVGVYCLERGRTVQDTDFVRRKIAELLTQVEHAVTGIPTRAEEALLQKMGTADGQVLGPVKKLIDDASAETTRRISDLKSLLSSDLDPNNAKSTLGSALQSLRDLLNPKNTDSIQSALDQAVTRATAENGALAKAVKARVEEALKRFSCHDLRRSFVTHLLEAGADLAVVISELTTIRPEPLTGPLPSSRRKETVCRGLRPD